MLGVVGVIIIIITTIITIISLSFNRSTKGMKLEGIGLGRTMGQSPVGSRNRLLESGCNLDFNRIIPYLLTFLSFICSLFFIIKYLYFFYSFLFIISIIKIYENGGENYNRFC